MRGFMSRTLLVVDDDESLVDSHYLEFERSFPPPWRIVHKLHIPFAEAFLREGTPVRAALVDIKGVIGCPFEFADRIHRRSPETLVAIFSGSCYRENVTQAFRSGLSYIVKDADSFAVDLAIFARSIAAEDRAVWLRIMRHCQRFCRDNGLSGRHAQILQLACFELSRAEIADETGLMEGTVKVHIERLLEKLQAAGVHRGSLRDLACRLRAEAFWPDLKGWLREARIPGLAVAAS